MKDNCLKVCFVGIGSIGSRHIKNLRHICDTRGIKLIIDALRRRDSAEIGTISINNTFYDYTELPDDYDAIFITNPTSMHMNTLLSIHDKSDHFFIEKPLTSMDSLAQAKEFAYSNDKIYYVACPMRYEKVLQYIKHKMDISSVIAVRSICSSYLPDWRPGIDYRKCYSARKKMGGGVSIDLIHEWDYITWLFGYPTKIYSMIGKKSHLEIDADDYAIYIAEYKDKTVELHLDYFGRFPIRKLQMFTEKDTIECDFLAGTISNLCKRTIIRFDEERDDYQISELEHFLDIVSGSVENDNTPEMAWKTIMISQGELIQ